MFDTMERGGSRRSRRHESIPPLKLTRPAGEILAAYRRHNPRRRLDWRWQRAAELLHFGEKPDAVHDDGWTRRAFDYRRIAGDCPADSLACAMPDIHAALQLHTHGGAPCWELQARILARETPEAIASKSGIASSVAECYEKLFFAVLDRKANQCLCHGAWSFRREACERVGGYPFMQSEQDLDNENAASHVDFADAQTTVENTWRVDVAQATGAYRLADAAAESTVIGTLASSSGRPWAQFRADLAAANPTWRTGQQGVLVNTANALNLAETDYRTAVGPAYLVMAATQGSGLVAWTEAVNAAMVTQQIAKAAADAVKKVAERQARNRNKGSGPISFRRPRQLRIGNHRRIIRKAGRQISEAVRSRVRLRA